MVAERYRDGEGTKRNLELAVTWYRKAARRNDVGAIFMMGRAYEYGEGVRQTPPGLSVGMHAPRVWGMRRVWRYRSSANSGEGGLRTAGAAAPRRPPVEH